MKILYRPQADQLAAASNKGTITAPSCFAAWPKRFDDFLCWSKTNQEWWPTAVDHENNLVRTKHGICNAEVVWSLETPLENSWRVAAFHSNAVALLREFNPSALQPADGITATGKDFIQPLAIFTADCLAVALTLESADKIELASCFHAGWRGYVGGIQQVVLNQVAQHMRDKPSTGDTQQGLHLTIGPAISGNSYPCGRDVLEALEKHHTRVLKLLPGWTEHHEDAYWAAAGKEHMQQDGKIMPDLQALLCVELHASGINLDRVAVFREDTFGSAWWPSHRRAMAQGLARAGRLVTHLCPPSACPQVQNHVSNP